MSPLVFATGVEAAAPLFWAHTGHRVACADMLYTCAPPPPRIVYASGEFEDVDLEEIVRDGHMALL